MRLQFCLVHCHEQYEHAGSGISDGMCLRDPLPQRSIGENMKLKAVSEHMNVLRTAEPIFTTAWRFIKNCMKILTYDLHIHSCLSPCGIMT